MQYELTLRDYVRIIQKHRIMILAIFFAAILASVFYVSTQPVIYRSSVTIKFEERKTIAGLLTEWVMQNPGNVMDSELRVIKGYPVLKSVAMKLRMLDGNSSLEEINAAVSALQARVETDKVGATNMIRITVTGAEPKETRDFANIVAETYMEENLREKALQFSKARGFIEEQLQFVEGRLKYVEETLQSSSDEFKNARFAEPIEKKLVDLEFQLAELLQKYTEKHPKVVQLQEQIHQMESQVKGYSSQAIAYQRLLRELDVNKKLYSSLNERLEEMRIAEAQKVADISIVEPAVVPAAPVSGNKRLGVITGAMLGLILGFSFAFLAETLDTSIGTIEDIEKVVKLPVLGVVPSVVEELSESRGIVQRLCGAFTNKKTRSDGDDRAIRLISHFKPRASCAEAYRNIHTNLKIGPERKMILVTSSAPGEGKSSLVTNLGLVMAQSGLKVLLVSTDLRKPVLAKTFGIKREPGLNEFVTKSAEIDAVMNNITDMMVGEMPLDDIRKTPGIENIWILTSGRLPSNPVELLESKELSDLMVTMRERFDVIIFDSPPVLPVTDASLLAPKMDCVVIVYEGGRTSREALMRTKVQLESIGAKIAGVVLNHTKPQAEFGSSYPYYSKYKYRYYGKDEKSR